jgi:GTPase SAR1 family protein
MVRESANPTTSARIIVGPAGSGKTTLVNKRKAWGHLVLDVDALFMALSGLPWNEKPQALLPFVLDARDAVIARLIRGDVDCVAWVITANGDMGQVVDLAQRMNASLTVLAVDRLECLRRISLDKTRQSWELYKPMVNEWWEKYERTRHLLPTDVEIITGR